MSKKLKNQRKALKQTCSTNNIQQVVVLLKNWFFLEANISEMSDLTSTQFLFCFILLSKTTHRHEITKKKFKQQLQSW